MINYWRRVSKERKNCKIAKKTDETSSDGFNSFVKPYESRVTFVPCVSNMLNQPLASHPKKNVSVGGNQRKPKRTLFVCTLSYCLHPMQQAIAIRYVLPAA